MKNDSFKKYIITRLAFIYSELLAFSYKDLARKIDSIQGMINALEDDDELSNNQAILDQLGRFVDQTRDIEDDTLRLSICEKVDGIQSEICSAPKKETNLRNIVKQLNNLKDQNHNSQ